jgi:hypothetical protein
MEEPKDSEKSREAPDVIEGHIIITDCATNIQIRIKHYSESIGENHDECAQKDDVGNEEQGSCQYPIPLSDKQGR